MMVGAETYHSQCEVGCYGPPPRTTHPRATVVPDARVAVTGSVDGDDAA
jgi:hypothetical protein